MSNESETTLIFRQAREIERLTAERDAALAARRQVLSEAVSVADRAANDYHDLANTQAENAADRISTELARLK